VNGPIERAGSRLQIVSGLAWAQGRFMGLDEPVVPHFSISDYDTGSIGAIAVINGLDHRTTKDGSWHGKISLLQNDLLLFTAGLYDEQFQVEGKKRLTSGFLGLSHNDFPENVCLTALQMMKQQFPELFDEETYCETWWSGKYDDTVITVKLDVSIEGLEIGYQRGSRPNSSDPVARIFGTESDFWI